MKKLAIVVVILILLGVGYLNKATLIAKADQLIYFSPCATPKTFRIGTIDPRFNINKEELIDDAEVAADAWKNDQGMTLVRYDPDASMPINMVYDQRQALNSQITNLNNQVAQQKDSLKPEISSYEQQVAQFKQKSDDLNQQVQYWNSKGGAPQDVYAKLIAQQQALQQQSTQLQQMASQLNQSTDAYNSQISQLNQKVDTFNNVLSSTPEEGEYMRNGKNEQIDIYITNSQQELIHTLAHEIGHSLGLGHNSNPNSIMYPYTNTAVTPSTNDEEALAVACQKQSIFVRFGENITTLLNILKQDLDTIVAK